MRRDDETQDRARKAKRRMMFGRVRDWDAGTPPRIDELDSPEMRARDIARVLRAASGGRTR